MIVGEGEFRVTTVFKDVQKELHDLGKNVKEGFDLALREVEKFEGALGRIGKLTEGIELRPRFQEAVDALEQGLQDARAQLGEPLRDVEPIDLGVRNISQEAAEATKSLRILQQQVENLRKASAQSLISPGTASREIQQTNAAIRQLGGETRRMSLNVRNASQEQLANATAIQKLRSQYNLLSKQLVDSAEKTAALGRLQRQARALGGDLTTEVSRLQVTAKGASGAVGLVGQASAKASAILGKFGLTMRDLNVIIGSGFLSTAGPALVALLAVGIVKAAARAIKAIVEFSIESAKLADGLRESAEEVRAIFGEQAVGIEDFARRSAIAFGTTEQAALSFAAKSGRFFESIGVGADSASELTEGLLGAAEVLRRTTGEFISSEAALQAVNDLVGGNIEGLRKLGIRLTESGLRAVGMRHGLELTNETLNDTQRGLLSTIAALEAAQNRFRDARDQPESLAEAFERFRAIVTTLVTELGELLLPVIEVVAEAFIGFVASVVATVRAIREFGENNEVLVDSLKAAAKFVIAMSPGLKLLATLVERFGKAGKAVKDEAFEDVLADIDKALEEAVDSYSNLNDVARDTPEHIKKTVEAYKDLEETIKDAAKAEREAFLDIREAREDARKQVADALEAYKEAKEDEIDAVNDAREALEEAEEERVEAIADAREKLADTIKDQAKKIRDAEEGLDKARVEGTRKVEDAERRLFEARIRQREQLTDAQLSLEEALFRGDIFAINRAQLELSRAKKDRSVKEAELALQDARREKIEAIAEAEEKLKETQLEAAEAVQEAKERLTEVIEEQNERVLDAQEKLNETIIEQEKRVSEALERYTETRLKAKERIAEAIEKLLELEEKNKEAIEEARDKVRELEGSWDDANESLSEHILLLDEFRNKYRELAGEQGRNPLFGPGGEFDYRRERRQHGGPVFARNPYLVGEAGPELFIPNNNGSIVSNDQLLRVIQRMMTQRGGPSSFNVQIPVYESVDAQATAAAISARLARGVVW